MHVVVDARLRHLEPRNLCFAQFRTCSFGVSESTFEATWAVSTGKVEAHRNAYYLIYVISHAEYESSGIKSCLSHVQNPLFIFSKRVAIRTSRKQNPSVRKPRRQRRKLFLCVS